MSAHNPKQEAMGGSLGLWSASLAYWVSYRPIQDPVSKKNPKGMKFE